MRHEYVLSFCSIYFGGNLFTADRLIYSVPEHRKIFELVFHPEVFVK